MRGEAKEKQPQRLRLLPFFLASLTSLLLIASFPPFNFFPLAWVAFVPLFFSVQGTGWRKSAFLFFLSTFLLFLELLHWLSIFGWYAWATGAAYEGILAAIWGILSFRFLSKPNTSSLKYFTPALVYVLLEIVRNLGSLGMPWGDLAYTQWRFLPMVQWSSLLGTTGLSFLIIEFNLLLFFSVKERSWKPVPALLLCFLVPLLFGLTRLRNHAPATFKIALVQTNDPQNLKWSQANFDAMLSEMSALVNQAAPLHPDLILFPETALAGYLDRDPGLQSLAHWWAHETRTYLAVGTLEAVDGHPENAVVLISPQGVRIQSYEKIKLVPFGEYLPSLFRPLKGKWRALDPVPDFLPGRRFTVFNLPGARFSAMICFESSFGWISRRFVLEGANFLAVATNDAWFEGTNAQEEHAAMAVFRAAETERSFVQAGNTGISCAFDPWGRRIAWQRAQTRAILTAKIPLETAFTPYDRMGDIFPYFWGGFFLLAFAREYSNIRKSGSV